MIRNVKAVSRNAHKITQAVKKLQLIFLNFERDGQNEKAGELNTE